MSAVPPDLIQRFIGAEGSHNQSRGELWAEVLLRIEPETVGHGAGEALADIDGFEGIESNLLGERPEVERLKREDGLNTMEAPKQGAETRRRPILMTAIVTILALTPLALGLSDGALLSASLATVVIGGLFSSTLLTLFVIPAVYSLFDGLRSRFTRNNDGIDPLEPGRPVEAEPATTF